MHQKPPYPIVETLARLLESTGVGDSEFIRSLGYRNINKGVRRLREWLQDGDGEISFLQLVQEHYPAISEAVEVSLNETRIIREREKFDHGVEVENELRRCHRPCLIVETTLNRPSQITLFGIYGWQDKVIPLPSRLATVSEERALKAIRWVVRKYLERGHGLCPFWGRVTGFTASIAPDRNILMSVAGVVEGESSGLLPLFTASIEMKFYG